MAAAIIPRRLKNVELQIYDKNEEIGGTWFENTYPGIACDVYAFLLIVNGSSF